MLINHILLASNPLAPLYNIFMNAEYFFGLLLLLLVILMVALLTRELRRLEN